MITRKEIEIAQERATRMLEKAGITITPSEQKNIEVADLNLGELAKTGVEIVIYVNNDRYCAKELILFPKQTCPEHRHPAVDGQPGKMETFRCRWGRIWLYLPGEPVSQPKCRPPSGSEPYYTVFHEIELNPGDQYTIPPNTLHWFQAGNEGAIVSEFSSTSRDESDMFTDPRIRRLPEVTEP
jgi:D-lyxose ketol-isomerase